MNAKTRLAVGTSSLSIAIGSAVASVVYPGALPLLLVKAALAAAATAAAMTATGAVAVALALAFLGIVVLALVAAWIGAGREVYGRHIDGVAITFLTCAVAWFSSFAVAKFFGIAVGCVVIGLVLTGGLLVGDGLKEFLAQRTSPVPETRRTVYNDKLKCWGYERHGFFVVTRKK